MTLSAASISKTDPTTAYALFVLSGDIIAGPHVRDACKRHIDDLTQGRKRGLVWDVDAANRAIEFFPDVLVAEVNGVQKPFDLLDWQVFCTGSIFGWKKKNGFRRFNTAYIEGGKGCGKSPWAAGIGLYMLIVDKEPRAEIYSAAASADQSRVIFDDAVSAVNASRMLRSRVMKTGQNIVTKLIYRPTNSTFKPLSGGKMKSGIRVYCALVDELHEHKDRYVVDQMKAGFKGRRQPLMLVITNAGFDKNSVCYEWHDDAINVAEGLRVNDTLFSYVMAVDIGEDPLMDPSCWPKTNPGLGITIQQSYLEDQVRDAITIPGREALVRRLNFCEWTDAEVGWLTRGTWLGCEEQLVRMITPKEDKERGGFADLTPFLGAKCTLGLDISRTFDLTALAFSFLEDDMLLNFVEYFTPMETAPMREKLDRVPYQRWIQEGLIHGCPGKVVRKEHIASRLAEVKALLDVEWVAYDRYGQKALAEEMDELGVDLPWIEHPQGFRRGGKLDIKDPKGDKLDNPLWMPSSITGMETRILQNTFRVQPSVVTRWQVSSVVIREDPAGTGGRVFNKLKSKGKIDGLVALAQSSGASDMRLLTRDLSGFARKPIIARPK